VVLPTDTDQDFARTANKRVLPRITERIVQSSRALMIRENMWCKDQSGIDTTEGEGIEIA